jgi:hypothetical protein
MPILNPGCGFCDYRMDCPAWLELPGMGKALLERIRNTELEAQMALRPEANDVRLRLEHFTGAIDELARSRLTIGSSITAGEVSVERKPREQDQVEDLRAVHDLLGDEFYKRATISKKALEQYGRDVPEARGKVRELLVKRVVGDALSWSEKK